MPRGHESDYRPLYVIRAKYGDDLIPGKYNSDIPKGFISYGGGEHGVSSFEVPNSTHGDWTIHQFFLFKFFVATNVKWQPASNGVIPANAVVGGGRPGAILYIGRVKYNGKVLGKIDPRQGGLFVPYNGKEVKFTEYEQLVYV